MPVAVVGGLLIFVLDAGVAPGCGLDILYLVLLLALAPALSGRQRAAITAAFMGLAALAFLLGRGEAATVATLLRLAIAMAALPVAALLIAGRRGPDMSPAEEPGRRRESLLHPRDRQRVMLIAASRETVAIADDVIQQLTAAILGGTASRKWLDRPEPDLAEARAAIDEAVASARRACDLVQRLRQQGRARSRRAAWRRG